MMFLKRKKTRSKRKNSRRVKSKRFLRSRSKRKNSRRVKSKRFLRSRSKRKKSRSKRFLRSKRKKSRRVSYRKKDGMIKSSIRGITGLASSAINIGESGLYHTTGIAREGYLADINKKSYNNLKHPYDENLTKENIKNHINTIYAENNISSNRFNFEYLFEKIKLNFPEEEININLILKILEDRDGDFINEFLNNDLKNEYELIYQTSIEPYYYINTETRKLVRLVRENKKYNEVIDIFDNDPNILYIEKDNLKKISKYDQYDVIQYCCNEQTQYPSRMCNESIPHILAAKTSKIVGIEGEILDGIIKIDLKNNSIEGIKEEVELLNYGDDDLISDHIGVNFTITYPSKFNFNIISYNLEGLCTGDSNYEDRKRNLKNQLKDKVDNNTIMVCQELFFRNDTDEQRAKNINTIKDILIDENFVYDADKTSCLFYNNEVWNVQKLEIKRNLGKFEEDKCSNAYKFKNKHNDISFVVVNIHLLARTPGRELTSMTGIGENIDLQQENELSNIINKTINSFEKYKVPIYLCGDFNRNLMDKSSWVKNIIMKLNELDIQKQILEYLKN